MEAALTAAAAIELVVHLRILSCLRPTAQADPIHFTVNGLVQAVALGQCLSQQFPLAASQITARLGATRRRLTGKDSLLRLYLTLDGTVKPQKTPARTFLIFLQRSPSSPPSSSSGHPSEGSEVAPPDQELQRSSPLPCPPSLPSPPLSSPPLPPLPPSLPPSLPPPSQELTAHQQKQTR